MAVVGGVGSKRFTTVLAFEGLLPGMLPDVCAEDAGGSELLPRIESGEKVSVHQRQDQVNKRFCDFIVSDAHVIP